MSDKQSFFQRILAKINRAYKQIRGLFPSALPQGMVAHQEWAQDIASLYVLPTNDTDSINFALATMIMHLGPNVSSKSMYYFVNAIRATAAKQVAGAVFQDIKLRQKAAEEAAKKAAAEATALQAAASDAPKQ